tara:strand:- start:508 stop:822 length:315 start_codon:yes stop_codon:yes gene_type:complete
MSVINKHQQKIFELQNQIYRLKNEIKSLQKEEGLFEDVHKYLLDNKLEVFNLSSIPWWQEKKKYGLVKRMSKREGGFKKFKIDYYKYLRRIYDINLKKLQQRTK